MEHSNLKFDKVVIDCQSPATLADFYCRLLGWEKGYKTEDFVIIGAESSNVDIGFQKNTAYTPPVWPEEPGAQQMMEHLDFSVGKDAFEEMVQHAINCGAKRAQTQFSSDWTVMLDPEGHPFCIDAT